MYADRNFKTKKAFKEAVANGEEVRLFAPGLGRPKDNGLVGEDVQAHVPPGHQYEREQVRPPRVDHGGEVMGRYRVHGPWRERSFQPGPGFIVEYADALDTKTGTVYEAGAYRVRSQLTGKPVRGKGGTHPFYGETAWCDADRLASDLYFEARFQR